MLTTTPSERCGSCQHDEHEPGRCKNDNCGEGEISHSDAMRTDYTRVVTWADFRRGHVSTTNVVHIKPRRTGND